MIDFDVVGNNLLTVGILAFFAWIIYQNQQGNNVMGKFKGNFGKILKRDKFK